jgi:hypothetical protein
MTKDLAKVPTYRGLDFQAVWIFISRPLYDRVNTGKLSLSAVEWEFLRDLHIPLTRAKDELVMFVM